MIWFGQCYPLTFHRAINFVFLGKLAQEWYFYHFGFQAFIPNGNEYLRI